MAMGKEFYQYNAMMKRFLRSQGWYQKKTQWDAGYPASLHWHDPKGNPYWGLAEAYLKACRRKADREVRILKRAGWRFKSGYWIKSRMKASRAKALEYLKAN